MALDLTSPAFGQGSTLPAKYTCSGEGISPPLEWADIPEGTESFILICLDPDAPSGMFSHWVVFNLPPSENSLDEGQPSEENLASGALQGVNDYGDIGYGAPCPPAGPAHRYFFRLYAVDSMLDLQAGASRQEVMDRIQNHTLGSSELMVKFARK